MVASRSRPTPGEPQWKKKKSLFPVEGQELVPSKSGSTSFYSPSSGPMLITELITMVGR